MRKIFESELFIISQNDVSVEINDIRKRKQRLFNIDDKDLFYEISKCVELSRKIIMFDAELENTLLKEDLIKIDESRYVIKNSTGEEALKRTFTYHLMP